MRGVVLAGILVAVGCNRGGGGGSLQSSDAGLASADPPAPPAASSSKVQANLPASVTWSGTYKSEPGALYIPADWKNVHWSGSEGPIGTGEGTISLHVDGASGRVLGAVEGPLGPAIVDGVLVDGKLAATIARKNPLDRGFAGTLLGSIDNDRGTGTMKLSSAEANAVRVATFSLAQAQR
jgi:hypothetical protein